jgi:hypothetical protein
MEAKSIFQPLSALNFIDKKLYLSVKVIFVYTEILIWSLFLHL